MTAIETPLRPIARRRHPPVLLQGGFRIFFLLAGLQAAGFLGLWVAGWLFGLPVAMTPDPLLWHGHAMSFGFASAALAGFLLTAVPSWTGTSPVRGWRLGGLALLWVAARVLALWPAAVESGVFAAVDLAFWPALALLVGPGIVARNAKRNGVFVVILAALMAAAAAWHVEALGWADDIARRAVYAALGLFALMIAIIGGRIVPAFTIGGMRMAARAVQIEPRPGLDRLAIGALVLAFVAELLAASTMLQAVLFGSACLLHMRRFWRWQFWRTLAVPLVWSLHAGYAWLVVGLGLKAMGALGWAPDAAALHALGAGCLGAMILAVMTRASLGHTGRPLKAPASATIAYGLVSLGALARVVAAFDVGSATVPVLVVAGMAWTGGFLAFLFGYAGILCSPRVDGRIG